METLPTLPQNNKMGQGEVLKILQKKKNKGKWLTVPEINNQLKDPTSTTVLLLGKLFEQKVVEKRYIKNLSKWHMGHNVPCVWRLRE